MLTTIATAIWPLYFVLALGFAAGKRGTFPRDAAPELNKLAMTYALPAALFVSTASLSRQTLTQQLPSLATVLIAYLGIFLLAVGVVHLVFKRTLPEAAIAGMCAASPAGPLFGPAVLPPLFGAGGMIAVSVAALVLNLAQNPIAFALIGQPGGAKTPPGAPAEPAKPRPSIAHAVVGVVKEPVVWAPVLGIVFALLGIADPAVLAAGFRLLGSASAGIAAFASGLTLAAAGFHFSKEVAFEAVLKAVGLPALVTGVGLLCGVRGVLLSESIVASALSSGLLAMMLASRNRLYVEQAASTTLLTSVGLAVTLPLWILLGTRLGGR